MRRRLLIGAVVLLGGCTGPADADLATEYAAMGGENRIDQTVALENRGERAIAPRLELTPLDAGGEEIEGLEVRTAYGSDRGRRVLPAGTVVLDILSFRGAREREVEDVDVRVSSPDEVDLPAGVDDPEVVRITRTGKPARQFGTPFERFRISNVNDVEIAARAVFVEYEDPPEGESQQFTRITPLTGLVRIAAGETSTHTLPVALRDRVGSVKAYLSR